MSRSIKAGGSELTRKDEFQKLSQAQKDIIAHILDSQKLLLAGIETFIKVSETAITTRLDIQDALLQKNTQKAVKDIHDYLKVSEDRVVYRFDSQDVLLRETVRKQDAQARHIEEDEHDALKTRLLDALAFPEMNERRNMIEGRVSDFDGTYHWIFDPPKKKPKHDFVEWLQSGTDIFWVSGKPGSGKSSLMDFIYQNIQAERDGYNHLEKWAKPCHVRLLSFWFFRPASTILLKSLQGLWRSLCFQILDTDKTLVDKIRENRDGLAPQSLRSCLIKQGSRAQHWTDIELKSWFIYLITRSAFKYCLLIDGLDEVATNREALLDTTQYIAHRIDKIKICCSSRPEPPFLQRFQNNPSLQLQDFNYTDITSHCRKRLDSTRAQRYADEISHRAQGVFLWAYLVAEDLRDAAMKGDEDDDLERRIDECPGELQDLFMLLLERQDPFYAKHPKPYLYLIYVASTKYRRAYQDFTLFEFLVAASARAEFISGFPQTLDDSVWASLASEAVALTANVVARCANLIELVPVEQEDRSDSEDFAHDELSIADQFQVRFIHRSALDFLVDNEKGAALLRSYNMTEQEAVIRLMIASVTRFLVHSASSNIEKCLLLGSMVDAEFWEKDGTSALDIVFPTLQARFPKKMPPFQLDTLVPAVMPSFEVACSQLSPLENVMFGFVARFTMVAYTEAKLRALDSEKIPLAAGLAICLSARDFGYDRVRGGGDDFLIMLRKYLPMTLLTQNTSLWYKLALHSDDEWIIATCPMWQHLTLAFAHAYFYQTLLKSEQDFLGLIQTFAGVVKNGVSGVEGCIFSREGIAMCPDIFPGPDEPAKCLMERFRRKDVMRVLVKPFASIRGTAFSLEFTHYSPGGISRYLELGHPRKESLQRSFDENASLYDLYRDTGKCLVAILNDHLEDLSPKDIASVVFYLGSDPCVIFSKGEPQLVNRNERRDWEEELHKAGMCKDPVDDPVISEIIAIMKENPWRSKVLRI